MKSTSQYIVYRNVLVLQLILCLISSPDIDEGKQTYLWWEVSLYLLQRAEKHKAKIEDHKTKILAEETNLEMIKANDNEFIN